MSREEREGGEGKTVNQHLPILTEEATNEAHLKDGIVRVTNGLEGKDFFKNRIAEINFRKPSPSSRPSRDI